MQRGPPRPRESSAEGMLRTLRPLSRSTSLVTSLRSYTTMVPGREAQRVGAVVPLLALGRDTVAAAARDQLHRAAYVLGQNLLQGLGALA